MVDTFLQVQTERRNNEISIYQFYLSVLSAQKILQTRAIFGTVLIAFTGSRQVICDACWFPSCFKGRTFFHTRFLVFPDAQPSSLPTISVLANEWRQTTLKIMTIKILCPTWVFFIVKKYQQNSKSEKVNITS